MNVYTPLLTFILCLKSVQIKFNNNNIIISLTQNYIHCINMFFFAIKQN